MPEPTDETIVLLERWHNGETQALGKLLSRHLPRLHEYVSRNMRDQLRALSREQDSQDLVQNAAARALAYVPRFVPKDGEQFQRLLRTFVRNEIRNLLRAPRINQRAALRDETNDSVLDLRPSAHSSLVPDRAVAKAEGKALARLLAQMALEFLDEEDQHIIRLRQFDELSWEAAAAALELTPDAVRMRYNRALPKLANHVRRLREGRIDDLLEASGC